MISFLKLWAHFLWTLFQPKAYTAVGAPLWLASWIVIHHWYGEPRTRAEALKIALAEGYSDLPYNFIITKDGTIWTGRPVGSCAANLGINSRSIAICFLGNFQVELPTLAQMNAAAGLVRSLLQTHKKAKLIPHRDVFKIVPLALYRGKMVSTATACPGDLFTKQKYGAILWQMVNGLDFTAARKKVG